MVLDKGLDPNIQPEKQVIKSIAVTKVKEVPQIKPRLGQGRAVLRHKEKTSISNTLVQVMEKPPSKLLLPDTSKIQDITIPMPNCAILQVKPKGDMSTKMINRKTMQDVGRKILSIQIQFIVPSPKPVKHLYSMFLETYQALTQN